MADGSDTTVALDQSAPDSLIVGLKSFLGEHGGATAVIEYVGKKGARIVLIGEDGVWSEQPAPSTDVARSACAEAGIALENSWERELIEQMRPSNDLWRSMARRSLAR